MSNSSESAIRAVSSTTDSSAKVSAAILDSICAMASCWPIGRPHCTRDPAQSRSISREPFPVAAQNAGSASLPTLSVMSASLSPFPSPQTRFSRGTFTFVNLRMPLERARSPMKWHSCTVSTPSQAVSTTNAVIGLRLDPAGAGVLAITMMISARGPFVVQSFSPFRIQWLPSSESSAVVDMLAGSEPTSGSVSANADSAPFASRGR